MITRYTQHEIVTQKVMLDLPPGGIGPAKLDFLPAASVAIPAWNADVLVAC